MCLSAAPRGFPILHVTVFVAEDGQSQTIALPAGVGAHQKGPRNARLKGNAGERRASVISKQDMTHRFRTGQAVRLRFSIRTRSAAGGDYTVLRELPENGGETQYRIKSGREAHERVVNESDLESV